MPRTFNQLVARTDAPSWFKTFVADLNRTHVTIASELARVQGLDGHTPTFNNAPNFQGNRLTNVGPTSLGTDAPNRSELIQNAMYKDATGNHVAAGRIVASSGMTVPVAAAPSDAVPLAQISDQVSSALGAYQKTSEKDAANGYAGLDADTRVDKGVDTTDDVIVDLATKGLVLKDTQGAPHYWRVSVSTLGSLTTTDLGTVRP